MWGEKRMSNFERTFREWQEKKSKSKKSGKFKKMKTEKTDGESLKRFFKQGRYE